MAKRKVVSPDVDVEVESPEEEEILEEAIEFFKPTAEKIEEYEAQLRELLEKIPSDVLEWSWFTVIPAKRKEKEGEE